MSRVFIGLSTGNRLLPNEASWHGNRKPQEEYRRLERIVTELLWNHEIREAGEYVVTAQLASERGASLMLEIGDQTHAFTVSPSNETKTLSAGTFNIGRPGVYRVVLRFEDPARHDNVVVELSRFAADR